MIMRSCLLFFVVITGALWTSPCYGTWGKIFGNSPWILDPVNSVQQTKEGGYAFAGQTSSPLQTGGLGHKAWVVKLDSYGDIEWEKAYGSDELTNCTDQVAQVIRQTFDGGYVVLAENCVLGGSWLLKLRPDGSTEWQQVYIGPPSSQSGLFSIQQTTDLGYVVVGWYRPDQGSDNDYWVMKLDSKGKIEWQKTYGGDRYDTASSIQETSDGGFIVAGKTDSFGAGDSDLLLLRLDTKGEIVWQKAYGGNGPDGSLTIIQKVAGGGFAIATDTGSFGFGDWDLWMIKVDSDGEIEWQRVYGGQHPDQVKGMSTTKDGGYVVTGDTHLAGPYEAWFMRLNGSGDVVWQKTFDGGGSERGQSIEETNENHIIFAGITGSFDFDGSPCSNCGGHGLVLKLDGQGNIIGCPYLRDRTAGFQSTQAIVTSTHVNTNESFITSSNTSALPQDTSAKSSTICLHPEPLNVSIDIRPFINPNIIIPWKYGLVPVAILSTNDFNVPDIVDKTSLTFGKTGAEKSLLPRLTYTSDVNRDGLRDLVAYFSGSETGFQCGDTEGVLKGQSKDGMPIEGRDLVRIIPCK